MASLMEDIDSAGDTLIIIPYLPQSSQVKDQPNDEDDQAPTEDGPRGSSDDAPAHNSDQVLQQEDNSFLELRLKVSKKHLTVASRRARAMFTRDYQESQPSETDGLCYWKFEPLFEPEAFRIVMKIFHLQTRDLPESVTLDMMAHIAAIVDDLQCHDAVWFVTKAWIKQLNHRLPSEICKDLIRWILIASVFRETELFESTTRTAILHSTFSIPTFGLPIQPNIIDMIEKKRQDLLEELINQLHNQVDRLRDGRTCVASGCSSMLLGALIREMSANDLFSPRPSKPFPDTSLSPILETIRSFQSPTFCLPEEECFYDDESKVWELEILSHSSTWKKKRRTAFKNIEYVSTPKPKRVAVHRCSLQGLLHPELKSLQGKIEGLELPDAGTSSN
ncbi:hypothetical protein LCI18_008187 [Fusarium solani-melongenae]|uniref:Uncharacterized protein n=1 Tax=Fusarium solani subsp. cucurbitae TaxID=2747967 RepID=A0ACD3Z824_FUSSC|nr:hypothetical protein LCI18_008187 [Fusarium solani-melongenae]